MKQLSALIAFFVYGIAFSQGNTIESFIPTGWKQIAIAKGDLNNDGAEDIALVVEDTKKENFKNNKTPGEPLLNLNPRQLLMLFKDKRVGYRLIEKRDSFIPKANSEETPCLADPLLNDGGIDIMKGTLFIFFNFYFSCDSYVEYNHAYTFRYQDNALTLIQYQWYEFNRMSGDITSKSIDFLTRKKITTTGDNQIGDFAHPKKTTKDITIDKLIKLQDINRTTEIDF